MKNVSLVNLCSPTLEGFGNGGAFLLVTMIRGAMGIEWTGGQGHLTSYSVVTVPYHGDLSPPGYQ